MLIVLPELHVISALVTGGQVMMWPPRCHTTVPSLLLLLLLLLGWHFRLQTWARLHRPPSTVIRDILWRALLCSASSAARQLTGTKKLKIIRWQILTENITILLLPSLRLFLQVTFLESSAFTWLGSTPLDLAIFRSLVSIPALLFV